MATKVFPLGNNPLESYTDERGGKFPTEQALLEAFKEGTVREMTSDGQFGDIMSQWHRGFHRDLAKILGAKSDPHGNWGNGCTPSRTPS